MNGFGKLFLSGAIVLIAFLTYNCRQCLFGTSPIPAFNEDEWWGPGEAKKLGEAIAPFKIEVADKVIADLNKRLDRYLGESPTPPVENSGFSYGFNANYLREVVSYWRNKYNWSERQKYLNKFPQYKTFINGLDIHFIMVKPRATSGKKVVPLLLLHGWPGSVREFYELIPMLTTPREGRDFVFQVIAPSLPGYGFSSGASKPGLATHHMAAIMKNLMKRLGFDKFYIQGGDWGATVAFSLATLHPDSVLGVHSNFCADLSFSSHLKWFLGSFFPSLVVEEKHKSLMYPMKDVFLSVLSEMGYMMLQSTKPDTIGAALDDTPVGLAAYILEKYSTWTNKLWMTLPDGGLTKKFSLDALLDNVMIYWITGSITTSVRLYKETMTSATAWDIMSRTVLVPTVCARFPHELMWQSKWQLEGKFKNLMHVSDHEDGGHFPALEMPDVLAEDISEAVERFERFHLRRAGDRT